MSDDVAYIAIEHTIACPACGGPFVLTIRPDAFALMDAIGVTDEEVLQRLEAHLAARTIVCPDCQGKGQG